MHQGVLVCCVKAPIGNTVHLQYVRSTLHKYIHTLLAVILGTLSGGAICGMTLKIDNLSIGRRHRCGAAGANPIDSLPLVTFQSNNGEMH